MHILIFSMNTTSAYNFDDIRSLRNEEVPQAIEKLVSDPIFQQAIEPYIEPVTWEQLKKAMLSCETVGEFQKNIIYPSVLRLVEPSTTDIIGTNFDVIKDGLKHVFISNHRDIVLDAALLNIIMFNKGLPTTEIAIGDNLLIYPWIKEMVRINKSFIVKRGISIRQTLEVSHQLSSYIYHVMEEKKESVWLAQREGRAKDSNDCTQTSLIKMLTLHNKSNPLDAIINLDIVPLAITYEYDPCDYLKAKEFQLKRDNPDYKKTQEDDLLSMETGLLGFKGNVCFQFGMPINDLLDVREKPSEKSEIISLVAQLIDEGIFRNYVFFPHNYVAHDMMMKTYDFTSKYTAEDKQKFEAYIDKQIQKVHIPNKDEAFLRQKIVEMYANPLMNHLSVTNLEEE